MQKFKTKKKNIINGKCWIAYFDILGFKDILSEFEDSLDVFVKEYYQTILKEINNHVDYWQNYVKVTWASDSFLFFTTDDSTKSFYCINNVAQRFFCGILSKLKPTRASLAFGNFYADVNNGIYVGPALVDAYEYAEKQNWIGFVLTPSAADKVQNTKFSTHLSNHLNFIQYDVPIKEKEHLNGTIKTMLATENLYTYRITKYSHHIEQRVRAMYQFAQNKYGKDREYIYKDKYENTLRFIESLKQSEDST